MVVVFGIGTCLVYVSMSQQAKKFVNLLYLVKGCEKVVIYHRKYYFELQIYPMETQFVVLYLYKQLHDAEVF